MGGYGSTRWNWERTRHSTAGLLRLDARALKRAGALRPGVVCSVGWGKGQSIVARMDRAGECLTLDYATRRAGETDWTQHRQPVWLETTPCHYGGHRVWFACPGCQSRRAVLFSLAGVFLCRACHDLAHASTRLDPMDRTSATIRRLQQRLGADAGCDSCHIPPKPVRMHWRTYERLVRELRQEMHRNDGYFDQWAARATALLERLERSS